ncbi:TNFAIP3-interacting protein 1 isoform X4 [Cynoglossus semilaevis]|uniref:TNFAIP3-interacting protein 1 isoform X4 n=1 Tax=Cynoglossus semilaevis TaxID=244447 RepID=UPI000D628177|nr:TNFAIP3-interacting protein 1-like isoform X4 [Cynoglossus semilaevis]
MDGDVLSVPSFSLLSPPASERETEKSSPKSEITEKQLWHKSTETLWTGVAGPVGDRLLSTEEQVTLITESMTVSSTDQEKVLLLNKNTELRRVNKELMKLNDDWDQVYRSATLGLQQRLEASDVENTALKQLNSRLLLKLEHQQSAKDYYEQALMQELRKNQELQEYIRMLERRTPPPDRAASAAKQGSFRGAVNGTLSCPTEARGLGRSQGTSAPLGDTQQEVQDLKEQLEALRCQTQIYEEEYQTKHQDHKQTLEENRRLREKREEMRHQVALLQEQLKVYEDDFRRERSDKQVLQRLLLKKTHPNKDPMLVHRCNNAHQPQGDDKRSQSAERRKARQPPSPKRSSNDKESDWRKTK